MYVIFDVATESHRFKRGRGPREVPRPATAALIRSGRHVDSLLGGFLASFRTGRNFCPDLDLELKQALMLAKVAEALAGLPTVTG